MKQQPRSKVQQRTTDAPSQLQERPAMVEKRRHTAGPPRLHTTTSAPGTTRQRPATAMAALGSCPWLVKRRSTPASPPHQQHNAATQQNNKRSIARAPAGEVNTAASTCNKRSASESSPRPTKRRKTQTRSHNEQTAATVTEKRDIVTPGAAGEPNVTAANNTKKRSLSESSPRSTKRRKTQTQSHYEQTAAAVTEKRDIAIHGAAGEPNVAASNNTKKRSLSEHSPRSTKRRKINSVQKHDVSAAIQKHRDQTKTSQGKTCVTRTHRKRKRSPSQSVSFSTKKQRTQTHAATPFPRGQTSNTPLSSTRSQPRYTQQDTVKTQGAERRQAEPRELSEEERETEQLLHQRGVRLFKTSDVKDITSLGTKVLGWGAYGWCDLVVDPNTSQKLVIKKFSRHALDELATEAVNLQELRLPGVQRLVGVCVPTRQLITAFAGTTLSKYFSQTKPSFVDAISVFLQISRTLQQILEKGFSHNDIKGDNICVQVDGNAPKATIIDLGFVRRVGTTHIYEYMSDTDALPWLAPELLLHTHPCGEASDVYSVAQLLTDHLNLGYTRRQRLLAALNSWLLGAKNITARQRPRQAAQTKLLAALNSWILAAKNVNPRKRPRLAALTHLLQRLHHEATRGARQ